MAKEVSPNLIRKTWVENKCISLTNSKLQKQPVDTGNKSDFEVPLSMNCRTLQKTNSYVESEVSFSSMYFILISSTNTELLHIL